MLIIRAETIMNFDNQVTYNNFNRLFDYFQLFTVIQKFLKFAKAYSPFAGVYTLAHEFPRHQQQNTFLLHKKGLES